MGAAVFKSYQHGPSTAPVLLACGPGEEAGARDEARSWGRRAAADFMGWGLHVHFRRDLPTAADPATAGRKVVFDGLLLL